VAGCGHLTLPRVLPSDAFVQGNSSGSARAVIGQVICAASDLDE
jgi:hypothetical protein